MAIDMRPLLKGEVSKISLEQDFPIKNEDYMFDTEIDDVVFTKDAHISGEITDMGGYIRLDAIASVEYNTECARCLKELTRTFEVRVERTVVNRGELVNTSEDDGEEYIEIVDGMLDVERVSAEQIIMDFPMKDICSEDCKGLCPKCGKNLNEGECNCPKKEIDPRLEILQKLLEK